LPSKYSTSWRGEPELSASFKNETFSLDCCGLRALSGKKEPSAFMTRAQSVSSSRIIMLWSYTGNCKCLGV
jgi:hypothetical protein